MEKFYKIVFAVAMIFGFQGTALAETYQAWGSVMFKYVTTPMYDANETIDVTGETITFHSDTWGDGTFAAATGEGTLTMSNHGSTKDYPAVITGSVESKQFVINVPSVMGGTVITSTLGNMPATIAVAGSYKGGSYGSSTYFKQFSPEANKTVTIKANEGNETVNVFYSSDVWGTFSYAAAIVTANEDGSYTLAGEGICTMASQQGVVKDYASVLSGTIKDGVLVAEFNEPTLMGGFTLYFNPSDIEDVLVATSIETVRNANADKTAYNMNGMRVSANYKGIVIKNGKRYLRK